MPNFYLIKNNGIADGSTIDSVATNGISDTLLTGAWSLTASEYFGSRELAIENLNNPPVDGDIFIESDLHSFVSAGAVVITIPAEITIQCVDDSNRENISTGSSESTPSSGFPYTIELGSAVERLVVDGANIIAHKQLALGGSNGSYVLYKNTVLDMPYNNAGTYIFPSSFDGVKIELDNADITYQLLALGFRMHYGVEWIIKNSLISTGDTLFYSGGNEGGIALVENTDLSGMASGTVLLASGDLANDSLKKLVMKRCKMPASFQALEPGVIQKSTQVNLWSCHAGDGYHYFQQDNYVGYVKENTSVKRTGGATYDGINGFSVEFYVNDNAVEISEPERFKLVEKTVDLTSGGATLTIHLTQRNTAVITPLTDKNCILKAYYSDATDLALGVEASSSSKGLIDIASNLTTSTEIWTATGDNETKQQVSVTIPEVALSKAQVVLYLEVSKDMVNDDSGSGELFVCSSPVVS